MTVHKVKGGANRDGTNVPKGVVTVNGRDGKEKFCLLCKMPEQDQTIT